MSEKTGYITSNRTKILNYMKENKDCTFTVADIDNYLKEHDCEVNVTTIYRYLDKLVNEGAAKKYVAPKGGMATYQYVESGHNCDDHLHLKCQNCGKVIHLECEFMKEISKHINEHHGFSLQCKDSVIYGTCSQCKSK